MSQTTIDVEGAPVERGGKPEQPAAHEYNAGALQTRSTAPMPVATVSADGAMSVSQIIEQVGLIQAVMRQVMQEGEHFGAIPGCGDKKTLLQPGAQKLCMTFRFAPEYEIHEVNLPGGHREYRVTCSLKSIMSGRFVGSGVGICSTQEAKYRYKTGPKEPTGRPVPKEYWDLRASNPGKAMELLGGKGFTVGKNAAGGWEICQQGEKVEHDNPADYYNTVLKMGKKRAFVDATITATAASDIFTQDIGDPESDGATGDVAPQAASKPAAAPATRPAPAPAPSAPPRQRETPAERAERTGQMPGVGAGVGNRDAAKQENRDKAADLERLEKCKTALLTRSSGQGGEFKWAWWAALVDMGLLLDSEMMDAVSPTALFPQATDAAIKARFEEISTKAQDFFEASPEIIGEWQAKFQSVYEGTSLPAKGEAEAAQAAGTADGEEWREFVLTFGKCKGQKLGEVEKNYLFGLWANYTVETVYDGKPRKQERIDADKLLRAALDDAGAHYQFKKD